MSPTKGYKLTEIKKSNEKVMNSFEVAKMLF